jgi:thiamine-phosphate pyrophosphorylase
MLRCHITDRKSLGGTEPLLHRIALNDASGVDLIQIREKDLPARQLAALVLRAVSLCRHSKILVNSRLDIALACAAAGAHLPSDSPPPSAFRPFTPPGFLIGVSCHNLDELLQAEREGAGYALFSPVFQPLSKDDPRPPLGLEALRTACAAVRIPVYALGGVTNENAPLCAAAGAAGVAAITLFQS